MRYGSHVSVCYCCCWCCCCQCQVLLNTHVFPSENKAADIPMLALSLPIPVDQAPPLVTWSKFAPSIWTAWENEREPLEVRPQAVPPLQAGDRLTRASVGVCRGYSRSTIIAFGIARTLMIEDLATMMESEKEEFTRWGSTCSFFRKASFEQRGAHATNTKPSG